MIKRINKKLFLRISKKLHSAARDLGYKMIVHWRPINWKAVHNGTHIIGHVSGWCDVHTKRMVITVYGKASRARILYVMRHELRHAEHAVYGLYADYYKDHRLLWDYAQGKLDKKPKIKRPSNKIGYLAELDCDRTADKFLKSMGILTKSLKKDGKYPYIMTAAYRFNHALDVRDAERRKRRKT